MSYANFIPDVWAEEIVQGLIGKCVYAEDCHRLFEGNASKPGETVKLVGLGDPTIHTLERADLLKKIPEPEVIEDISQDIKVNTTSVFHYFIGDVDAIQAKYGIKEALRPRTTRKIASEIDKHIAKQAIDPVAAKMFKTPMKVVADTPVEGEVNVLKMLSQAATLLYKNDVDYGEKIVAEVSPDIYELFIEALTGRDTDNSEILEKGRARRYGNMLVKMSNNVARTNGGAVEHLMVRTTEAISYVHTHTHVEAYRPEGFFADAIKGFALYQSKITKPKELISIPVTH